MNEWGKTIFANQIFLGIFSVKFMRRGMIFVW